MFSVLPRILFLFSCFLTYSVHASLAGQAVVLSAKGEDCRRLPADEESAAWQCPGPEGYNFSYEDHVTEGGLSFGLSEKEKRVDTGLAWPPSGEGISSRIEWQLDNGTPVAAIIGRWRHIGDAVPSTDVEELLVVKVTPSGGCALGIVGALAPDAMRFARNLANARATTFRCGGRQTRPTNKFSTGQRQEPRRQIWSRRNAESQWIHYGVIALACRPRRNMI
jgi:hypothetical protein